ncbi:MAG TPA: CPBP family intramembrane glutamic endopeptidase [Acidobacteriaceae bacterium]
MTYRTQGELQTPVASTLHLVGVLGLLAAFPLLLWVTDALLIAHVPLDSPGHTRAMLRFAAVVTGYLWTLFAVTALWVRRGQHLVARPNPASERNGAWGHLVAGMLTLLALLVVGVGSSMLLSHLGIGMGPLQYVAPVNRAEAGAFLVLSLSAGFVEEFVFRGYLQRQLESLTASLYAASFLQVAIFTAGHLYQGWARLPAVFLVGAVLTVTSKLRGSLVPGMVAHGLGDGLQCIVYLARSLA